MPIDPLALPSVLPIPHLLEVAHVAHRLSASPGFVRRLIREGKLTAIRMESRWRIDPRDLEAYIDRCRAAHRRPDDDRSEVRSTVVQDHRLAPTPQKVKRA
jgi:excisionase family DNA binding protein